MSEQAYEITDYKASYHYELDRARRLEKLMYQLESSSEKLDDKISELKKAFKVDIWTEEERDGMLNAFNEAQKHHGMYESLFAVCAFILKHRLSKIEA